MARHNAVELGQRITLAHGQEGLHSALGRHRLDRDVLAVLDHRQAEPEALGPGGTKLRGQDGQIGSRGGRMRGDGIRMQVEQDRPSARRADERLHDAVRAPALQDRPGQGVFGVERPGEQVVLFGHEASEHRFGDVALAGCAHYSSDSTHALISILPN